MWENMGSSTLNEQGSGFSPQYQNWGGHPIRSEHIWKLTYVNTNTGRRNSKLLIIVFLFFFLYLPPPQEFMTFTSAIYIGLSNRLCSPNPRHLWEKKRGKDSGKRKDHHPHSAQSATNLIQSHQQFTLGRSPPRTISTTSSSLRVSILCLHNEDI